MPASSFVQRALGSGGPLVPPLALGSWNTWDRMSEGEAPEVIRRAVNAGAGCFDVAYYNMGPHAENSRTDILFGRALRESGIPRDKVFICGKLWLWDWPSQGFRSQLEESLDRAGLDRFDAVVVGDYTTPPDTTRLVSDIGELISDGLFDTWGINNWVITDTLAARAAADAASVPRPSFAQLKYSVARRSMAEGEHYGALFAGGEMVLQASDVFEGGVLLGRVPTRKIGADVGGVREQIADVAGDLRRIAESFDVTSAQLALAFCLAHPAVANVLVGASRLSQLEENLGAIELATTRGAEVRASLGHLQVDTEVAADGRWSPIGS